jgi:hypothetical protein
MHGQILVQRRAASDAAASPRHAARSVAVARDQTPPVLRPPAGELPLAGLLARAVQHRQRAARLTRQAGDVARGPLDAKQVANAIAYYITRR